MDKVRERWENRTCIMVWKGGGLTPALRAAADIIDTSTTADHVIDHIYTEYDDQGWSVNIVVDKILPSQELPRRVVGRKVYKTDE